MQLHKLCVISMLLSPAVQEILAHGMLLDPVNRSSMWRMGYKTPANYEDNQNYCGGRETMWLRNKGQCGPCGDDFTMPQPRPNENGGQFGNGVPVKRYTSGSLITVTAKITANHKGHFEFALCPLSSGQTETESCFEKYQLRMRDGSTKWQMPSDANSNYSVEVKLPYPLTCNQCSFRWQYVTGNNPDGYPETFRTCSDIMII